MTFELSQELFGELVVFILEGTNSEPVCWSDLDSQFRVEKSIQNTKRYQWLFSRVVAKMLEEHWLSKTDSGKEFRVGITFKGGTVLRHQGEIIAMYERHFLAIIQQDKKSIEKAAKLKKRQLSKNAKALAKTEASSAKQAKRLAKKIEKHKKRAGGTKKRSRINLFGSAKKIHALIPSFDNEKLLTLWKANTAGGAAATGAKKNQHLQIIAAIEKEWRHRVNNLPENEAFKWPSTEVGNGIGGGDFARMEESYLKAMGYTVGKSNGLPESTRRIILDRCFSGQLPPIGNRIELAKWASPGSAARLRKIAYHIAGLVKNFKKISRSGYDEAISDWEADLKYLHETYYVKHFHFGWPTR